jgi:hypothetical protein
MECYLISVALEVLYRSFVWEEMYPMQFVNVVPPPKLCCNNWTCIFEELPPIGEQFEAYCLNGVTMPAFVTVKEGGLLLTLKSDHIGEIGRYPPMALRPTHWRTFPVSYGKECF